MILPFLIAWLATRINCHQAHVIAYLREENRILKAKLKGKPIPLTDTERRRLAVLAHPIERKDLKDISSIATADTLQRWYRRLVVESPKPASHRKRTGRPRVAQEIEQLTIRMANENPTWGYRRIQGALSHIGYHIDKSTVRNILRRNHIDPAPIRGSSGMSWSQFIKLHWEVLEASGFFAELKSALTETWTIAFKPVQFLAVHVIQLARMIQHGALRILVVIANQRHIGTRVLAALTRPRTVSLQRVDEPLRLHPIMQERSPPGARAVGSALVHRALNRRRSASMGHLLQASPVLHLAYNDDPSLNQSQLDPCKELYRAAA